MVELLLTSSYWGDNWTYILCEAERINNRVGFKIDILHYSQWPRQGNSLNVHQQVSGKKDEVHRYNGVLLSHKIEWNHAFCSNMDGPKDDHAKLDKLK